MALAQMIMFTSGNSSQYMMIQCGTSTCPKLALLSSPGNSYLMRNRKAEPLLMSHFIFYNRDD